MKKFGGAVSLLTLAACLVAPVAYAGSTKCTMKFDLKEWAALYESAKGTGKITCDNGQSASVTIQGKGGGLEVGKFEVKDGRGSFTDVSSIDELFGKYVAADTSAAAKKAADAWVMTKDKVSLGLAGTGKGWELGFSIDEFVIEKVK
ncbi:MAG: hypothetical protein HYR72_03070 [Deltaproteobacteria bacterium]|nr:hypothetical protein [Deltaproteobacteria bacterium]MBI3388393.1 hypothetical protein [Deltaproteobacteria bacterium]